MVVDRRHKQFRDFSFTQGLKENEYGRTIEVKARSSLEAGAIIISEQLLDGNNITHSLVDPVSRP